MWIFYHNVVATSQSPMENFESTPIFLELLLFLGAGVLAYSIFSRILPVNRD